MNLLRQKSDEFHTILQLKRLQNFIDYLKIVFILISSGFAAYKIKT